MILGGLQGHISAHSLCYNIDTAKGKAPSQSGKNKFKFYRRIYRQKGCFIMKKTGYTVNHAEGKIILTKEFNKRASIPNSPEYNIMMTLRKDFPSYKSALKTISHNPNKKTDAVTYKNMIKHIITTYGENSLQMKAFEEEKKISLSKKAPYIYMKKWFKTQYPDYKVSVAEISENKEMEGSAA